MKKFIFYCFTLLFCTPFIASAEGDLQSPEIFQKLNQKINLDLSFLDQNGNQKSLREMFKQTHVLILTLNYYRCTTMCTFQFLNLAQTLNDLGSSVGNDFQIASVSFDPTDTVQKAQETQKLWGQKSGPQGARWNFYVGKNSNIIPLTKSLNFYYEKDKEGNYSHAAALFFIKPDGTFYRYLYGVVYDKTDFTNALIETSGGRVGSVFQKMRALFYKFDSVRGKYQLWI